MAKLVTFFELITFTFEKTTRHKSGKSKSFVMMSTVSELSNRKWKLMMTKRS